ncbi:MAG: GAP family protein [Gordonia sp. (in: high G+C Gram-positive bacteria)]|uniref:GAP family protein n=1 Tax=Gordonia sp. (in: high G+C Gram-positive bacteria) TaxID=84139 RepID=UPI0039E529D4
MNGAIGTVLPYAVGIAISPVPIIGAILLLLTRRARVAGPMYLLGWTLGILAIVVPAALVGSALPHDQQANGDGWLSKAMPLVIGIVFAYLAYLSWRSVPSKGAQTEQPKWMTAIESMSPGKALVIGFGLGFLNIKGALLDLDAGFSVAGQPAATQAVAITVFTVIGISTVAVPVIAYLIAGHRMDGMLEAVHTWLAKHGTAVVATLMTMLAAQSLGHGIALL